MPESMGAFDWRLSRLEERVKALEDTEPRVMLEQIRNLRGEVSDFRGEVTAMRRAFYTFALSITASAILFAFTIFSVLSR